MSTTETPTEDHGRRADWDRIEIDYRAGIKTLREIANEHGITEGAIRKRAKRDDWKRDLAAKVRAKAQDLVRKEQVRKEVRGNEAYQASERETIEVEAQVQARIELAHRTDVPRGRKLVMSLIDELEHQTDNRALYEELAELMHAPDDKGVDRLNDLYRKVISHGNRTDSAKKLADALKTLVDLERRVFRIDDVPEGGNADDLISCLKRGAAGG